MITNNIDNMAEDLEKQELEAVNGVASAQVYEQLLAIYLYQNDLCNAKYLWKRIPPQVKSSTAELSQIWTVAQHMWKRDFPATYKALNAVKWSETVADIMKNILEKVRNGAVDLISRAYSSISLDTLAVMTGLSVEVASAACAERGWVIEPDTRMVHPVMPTIEPSGQISSEDQLYKLTDFVSFLEN